MGTRSYTYPHAANNLEARVVSPAQPEPIEPLFNEAFVRIFGKDESKGLTRSLVNTILESAGLESIDDIESISAEHSVTEGSVDCKTPRFDVHIVSGNRYIDLEAQRYPEQIENRAIYYAAAGLASRTGKVKSYADLPQSIVIVLLDDPSPFPDSSEILHVCRWYWDLDDTPVVASDRQIIVLVELSKVHDRYNELSDAVLADKLLSWTYLITSGFRSEGEAGAIMDTYPDIEDWAELYGLAVNDPKVVQAYLDAQSAVLEYNNRQAYFERREREGFEKGHAEGLKAGLAEGRAEGLAEGRAAGQAEGRAEGLAEGHAEGMAEGMAEGRAEGLAEGIAEGRATGRAEERSALIEAMRKAGLDGATINAILQSSE